MPKPLLDYYKILGIPRKANHAEIRRAFYHRAKMFHPDINSSPKSIKRFQAIGQAYETLIDPEKRKKYDLILHYGYENLLQTITKKKPHADPKYRPGNSKWFGNFKGSNKKKPEKKDRKIIILENFLFSSLLLIGLAAVWFAGIDLMSKSFKTREHGMVGMAFGITFIILLILGWKYIVGRRLKDRSDKL